MTASGASNLPRSPAASHSRGPSVTPGMGAKVADTRIRSVSTPESELLCSPAGAAVGEVGGGISSDRAAVISGGATFGTDVVLFSASVDGTVPFTGRRVVFAVLSSEVRGLPGRGVGRVLGGGVVVNVASDGVVVFVALD